MAGGQAETVRAYSVCTETWHAAVSFAAVDGEIDRVFVGRYMAEGAGCVAEFSVSWFQFDPDKPPLMRLTVLDGAFQELVWQMSDLLEALALVDSRRITRPEFTRILDRLGFVDRTDREPATDQQREHAARLREAHGPAAGTASLTG